MSTIIYTFPPIPSFLQRNTVSQYSASLGKSSCNKDALCNTFVNISLFVLSILAGHNDKSILFPHNAILAAIAIPPSVVVVFDSPVDSSLEVVMVVVNDNNRPNIGSALPTLDINPVRFCSINGSNIYPGELIVQYRKHSINRR